MGWCGRSSRAERRWGAWGARARSRPGLAVKDLAALDRCAVPSASVDCEPLPVDCTARSTARAPPTPPPARAPHPSHRTQRLVEWAKTAGFRPAFVSFLTSRRGYVTRVTRVTGGAALARAAPAERSEVGRRPVRRESRPTGSRSQGRPKAAAKRAPQAILDGGSRSATRAAPPTVTTEASPKRPARRGSAPKRANPEEISPEERVSRARLPQRRSRAPGRSRGRARCEAPSRRRRRRRPSGPAGPRTCRRPWPRRSPGRSWT